MDEELFEFEYADELDAIQDVEYDEHKTPKSKRSLKFRTPDFKNTSHSMDIQDTKLLTPYHPLNSFDRLPSAENEYDAKQLLLGNERQYNEQNYKKRLSTTTDLLEAAADFFDSMSELVPHQKRARVSVIQADEDSSKDSAIATTAGVEHSDIFIDESVMPPALIPERCSRQRASKAILQGEFVSVTSFDGHRVYLKLRVDEDLEKEIDNISNQIRCSGLLHVPITVMKEMIEDEKQSQTLHETRELTARFQREVDENKYVLDLDEEHEKTISQQILWVEKYSPRQYIDLLSEESINRTLLHWLKQWDYVVFGKDLPVLKEKDKKKIKESNNKWKKAMELDSFKRPLQKVVLLCGPPGLGKTTLAHIVAKHAGYNVVEMNASDDRSVEMFQNNIEAATQMKSVMGSDSRPNCLIIDEIDGAPQAAVNVLINILRRPEMKKKKEGNILLRPIICICNDQYAPALRQLRQQALVLLFPPTESNRLASRLVEVVRQEHLKTDLSTLLALCEHTENDIRSCLNTLQFVHKRQMELTVQMVQAMNVGKKDSHRNIFSVWKKIFSLPRPRRNHFVSLHKAMEGQKAILQVNDSSPTARFQHVLGVAQAAGEHERIMQGLFENYLEAKTKDPSLIGLNIATEWLCFVDGLNQYTRHSQDYSLLKYVPFLSVTFHLLYATATPSRIIFPHVQFEVQQIHNKMLNLLTTLLMDMMPLVRKYMDMNTLSLDLLPLLLDIMQPTLRPVNTQLYSSQEKEDLAHLVHIMINYNITYKQERNSDGQYNFLLDPNVDEVVRFSGLKQLKQLTYGAKQLISREIELEKMRRSEAVPVLSSQLTTVAVPSHKETLETQIVKEDKLRSDFFASFTRVKRQKQNICKDIPDKPKERNVLDTAIWFHFKEGFSNAVRKNVHLHNLF